MTDYDIEQDVAETAWALSLGFDSAHDYHIAADEAFAEAQWQADQWAGNAE